MTKKLVFVTGAAVVLALALPSAQISAQNSDSGSKKEELFGNRIIAKGKGFEVKESEVEDAFVAYSASLASRGQSIPESQRAEVESGLRDRIIATKLLMTRATEADKAKAQETTEKIVEDSKKRFPSEEIFLQQLKASGVTPDQFRQRLLEQATCETVLDREFKPTIKVSDDAIKKFYDENPARFEEPEKVRASHILISTRDKASGQPVSAEKKKEKEELAQKLKKRAEAGEDFAKLAKEFSEDPGSKDKGGEYTFGRGEMVKPFEAAAFSLTPGKVSDVVETEYGYHIIKLSEKFPASKLELAKVSNEIRDMLVFRDSQKELPEFLEKLRKEAGVEVVGEAKKVSQ